MNALIYLYLVSANTFSVGILWKYDDDAIDDDNYVKPYYANLKAEIMQYTDIAKVKEIYEAQIYPKAKVYRQTELVKSLKVVFSDILSIDQLICMILYTDYTALSTTFSSTFRAKNKYEAVQSIKKRHQNYYWMSKGLKNMMHDYGQDFESGGGFVNPLRGPFYCGMNWVMNISAFNIILRGPTSTSIQITVASRFGGQNGILIEFDNTKGDGQQVLGFDVSWLSRYGSQEDERYER